MSSSDRTAVWYAAEAAGLGYALQRHPEDAELRAAYEEAHRLLQAAVLAGR